MVIQTMSQMKVHISDKATEAEEFRNRLIADPKQ